MTARARTLASCALGVALLVPGLEGQALLPSHGLGENRLGQYRNFTLRSDLATIAAAAGIDASSAKTIHQQPALLQDLEWRPSRWVAGSTAESTDAVERILFSFHDGRLFRVVVDYARDRTEGMTAADMIDAIGEVYGAPVKRLPGVARAASALDVDSGSAIARWGDGPHAVVLYRTPSYDEGFRLILSDLALSDLARKAGARAIRLDEQSAPSREIARQKKEKEDRLEVSAKARLANKKLFRP